MNHEEAAVNAFIRPTRRERYLERLRIPKKRAKFRAELAHFKAWNPKFVVAIPPSQHNLSSILKLLTEKGAGSKCWVVSERREMDGQEMDLETVLKETIGGGMGTLVSCVPGRLAYFEDEGSRYILERR